MQEHFTRRDFFKVSAVTASTPMLTKGSHSQSKSVQVEEPLHIGLMTYNLAKDWDIDTIIKNCTETKFEHVELRTTHAHGVEVSLTKAQRREVRKKFEDSPIKAISLASAFSYHHDDPKLLREHIEGTKEYTILAHDISAIGIRVFPNAILVDKGIPEERTLEQIGKALAEVGEFAKDYGVEIRVEVHGKGTTNIPRIKKIVDYSRSEHVYVNWNSAANDLLEPGFEANFNMVKDRIRNVHIHELWNEDYPYRKLFRLLKQAGYKGYCDAEIPSSSDPVRLMKYYRSLFLAYQNAI